MNVTLATPDPKAKTGTTVEQVSAWCDALKRVHEAVTTAPPIFFGGPTPAAVLEKIMVDMCDVTKGLKGGPNT